MWDTLVRDAIAARAKIVPPRCLLVGLSGIDGSGKGYVSDRLVAELQRAGLRAAAIHADGWLNLPGIRFSEVDPPGHFYRHAFRFDEMWSQLLDPLKATGSVHLVADHTDETATEYRPQAYDFDGLEVAVVEAIFLLRPPYRERFDFAIWIDCTFETALERAIARRQEGLPPAETVAAFETLFFPAQRLHLERDHPRDFAHRIVANDSRIE